MNSLKKEDLVFTDTADDVKTSEAILGTLEGPCADFIDSTRNGRHYSEELWNRVFADPIVNELIENGGVVGELDHPTDREETDSSRIAIIMREKPTKKNGKLWAKFDILNTPLGKIAYTLAKAGFKLGISSRGSGDVSPNFDGTEEVDESTYDFKAFDLVLLPAVKSARLNLVTEGLDTKKFNYKQALLESLASVNDKERVIMKETLDNLNIQLDDIDGEQEDIAVDDDKASFKELQDALKENKELAKTITSLQEKLSVSYAKEAELQEQVDRYLRNIKLLSNDAKQVNSLKTKLSSLNEEIEGLKNQSAQKDDMLKQNKNKALKMSENNRTLNEKYSAEQSKVEKLSHKIDTLTESYEQERKVLNESVADLRNTLEMKNKEYSQKLQKSNALVEKYKKIANKAVDKYIESQASMLGVSVNEIKNRLSESYSFDDIDSACEDLREYKLNMSKLPFRTMSLNENIQVKATPSKNEFILPANEFGDEVDEQLMSLAGLQ